jgi:hypothetical protein
VPADSAARDWLYATTWVHVFEQDTPQGAVFRPEEADIPLSRRPRERISLQADGSARFLMPGPDDRFVEHPEMRIVEHSPERLLVEMHRTPARP